MILPGRDRKACKNKFKAEDRKNPNRITYCLTHRRPYDIQTLSRMTGKDFSGPTPDIRAPTPIRLQEDQSASEGNTQVGPQRTKKQRKTPTVSSNPDEEIIGNVSDEEKDDEFPEHLTI
ncbi:hypothetical protein K474DRAFT_1634011 [Panus rudis PR-1116 ss-1]|nr:hypothetical protein K474DRAFT_1634011 [Panus rudis PR-1116 ss-1]